MKMDTSNQKKVIIIPCSGIGKAFGSISRDATYEVTENLRKDITQTLCLALLVSGDEESRRNLYVTTSASRLTDVHFSALKKTSNWLVVIWLGVSELLTFTRRTGT